MENIKLYQPDTSKNQEKIKNYLNDIKTNLDNINTYLVFIEDEQYKINRLNEISEFTYQCKLKKLFNNDNFLIGSIMCFNMDEDNKLHGKFKIMNKKYKDAIIVEGEYSNGKLHNKYIRYDSVNSGRPYIIANYNMGKLHDEYIVYDSNTCLKIEIHRIYENGVVIRDIKEEEKIKVVLPNELQ